MKLDEMNPAPPVTRTRLATPGDYVFQPNADSGQGDVQSLPRPRTMPRDFESSPVRVVIVDDHRLFVDAVAMLLGHDDRLAVIGTALDGRTAIELAVSEHAEVAVIDVRMPEIDGLEMHAAAACPQPGDAGDPGDGPRRAEARGARRRKPAAVAIANERRATRSS